MQHRWLERVDQYEHAAREVNLVLDDLDGAGHRPAVGMSQHNQQRHLEELDCEFKARQAIVAEEIPRHPDHEEVARSPVEDQLGSNPSIPTSKNRSNRLVGGH